MYKQKQITDSRQSPWVIQPALEISKEDDEYEREANTVADKVMRMNDGTEGKIQRMCTGCEEEEKKKMSDGAEGKLQMMVDTPISIRKMSDGSGAGMKASKSVEQGMQNSKGSGQSLSPDLQSEMSSKMGADFSGVKVHMDENAVQMNKEVGAKAFTHGSDIYFNQGQYNPSSQSGKHLLAHELTHTVQQGNGIRRRIQMASCPESTDDCEKCTGDKTHDGGYCRTSPNRASGFLGWACQNKNPGNIRSGAHRSKVITAGKGTLPCGSEGPDPKNQYMVFTNYASGRSGLKGYILGIMKGAHSAYSEIIKNGDCTLSEFFSHYAPSGDNNNPDSYAAKVANHLGVDLKTAKMSVITKEPMLEKFLDGIENVEGWFEKGSTSPRKR